MKIRTLLMIVVLLPVFGRAQAVAGGAGSRRDATLRLPGVFGDKMVLQRGMQIPVWGWSRPGAGIVAKLGNAVVTTKANREGKWMVHFPKRGAGGPYRLDITEEGSSGGRVELKDVLIGDVWVASGQSNMEWQVQQAKDAEKEISKAVYPGIRFLMVEHDKKVTPQTDIVTRGWEACDTASIKRFSAVAYFFARKIHGEEHVPIGIIQSTWGGTPIQAWTSREKLVSSPITREGVRATDTLREGQFLQDSINFVRSWDVVYHPQNGADKVFSMPGYDDSGWPRVEMPRTMDHFGIGRYEGIMWLRKKIVLPDAFAGKSVVLDLGHPEMNYSLYFNGVEICKNVWNSSPSHSYSIPPELLRKGENTVAVRMAMLWGGGGLKPPAEEIYIGDGDTKISLAGEWRYRKDLEPMAPVHNYQNYPSVLFNAMINPLVGYGICGFIWYQGEANDTVAYDYRKMFPMMITDWRRRWGRGDLPFLFVQLANFKSRKNAPAESEWAELREAQAMALSLPCTAMACTIDVGDGASIHPTDKQDVGFRLALGAEDLVYGRRGIASGPMYEGYTVRGDRVLIRLSNTGSGLRARDDRPITGFAVAGADRRFYWADAVVEGDHIVVHSDQVAKPVAVRYAWADNPDCNLENKEGLPAIPFRTDDFRGITQREREVVVDAGVVKGPLNRTFNMCVGAGRANEGLRADWQRQLRMVKDQLGFRYIRMHGLLSDDMGVCGFGDSGRVVYNWQYIDELYDFLESVHVRPFVELGFMPGALASGSKTIFWWRGNVTPPKDYGRWGELIQALVRHFVARYGEEEVARWYFEVWNEPNLKGGFWTGDQAEYFKLYAATARAIKSVSPRFRVGGPATAGNAWIPEFVDYCSRNKVPVDFVSTHTYGVDQGFLDEHGNRGTVLSRNDSSIWGDVLRSRGQIEHSALPGLELHYTEWSSSYTPSDPLHDSYQEAAYVLDKLRKTGAAANSMSYWTFTDIFEEAGPRFTPFHGGFGLVNYEDIAKPAYYAYKYLNQLGGTELVVNDAASWACKDEHGGIQLLFWDFTNNSPAGDSVNNQVYYKRDLPAAPKGRVRAVVDHLAPGKYSLAVYRTGYRANDPYDTYLDLGAPSQLTREQVRVIRQKNSDAPVVEREVSVGRDGRCSQLLDLRENDVYFINLRRLSK